MAWIEIRLAPGALATRPRGRDEVAVRGAGAVARTPDALDARAGVRGRGAGAAASSAFSADGIAGASGASTPASDSGDSSVKELMLTLDGSMSADEAG